MGLLRSTSLLFSGPEHARPPLVRLKVREALVRSRVNLIHSIRFLLKSLGVFVSSSIKAMAFTRKVRHAARQIDTATPSACGSLTDRERRAPNPGLSTACQARALKPQNFVQTSNVGENVWKR